MTAADRHDPARILMTADPIGGVWRYALELCRGLNESGIHVVLATMGAPLSPGQRAEIGSLPAITLHESNFPLEWMSCEWQQVDEAGEWLLQLARDEQVSLAHFNHLLHANLPFEIPILTVVHSCVCSWWRAVKGHEVPPMWSEYKRRVTESLRSADRIVAPTIAMSATLARDYSLSSNPVVVPNALPSAAGGPHQRTHKHPKQHFVFTAGRVWDEAKNIPALDRAASLVHWPVLVAGAMRSPDGQAPVLTNARSLGVLSSGEMRQYYLDAPIFALPALYEPFGLSILEAASAGCALVLGDIPSLRENWQGAAKFVDPRDPIQLANAINELIEDPVLRSISAKKAASRASTFSFDEMLSCYMKLYSSMTMPRSPLHPILA